MSQKTRTRETVGIRVDKPFQEYISGLGSVTIIRQSLYESLLLMEDEPNSKHDGTVAECLERWVEVHKEFIEKETRKVAVVEKLIKAIKEQGG